MTSHDELSGGRMLTPVPVTADFRASVPAGRRLLRLAWRKPLGAIGALVLLLLVITAIFADVIAPYDPAEIAPVDRLQSPNSTYYFGTNEKGQDVYSQVVLGSRVSVRVGLVAVVVSLLLGVPLGLLSGYFGGLIDALIQRLMDVQMAIPALILALTAVQMLGQSIENLMIVLGVVLTPTVNRVIRGSVLAVKQEQYIEAARAAGCTSGRIMFRHILPNVAAPVIVIATASLGTAILVEASLSFLGLGAPPPEPSWGRMLSGASQTYLEQAWWMAVFPGLAISLAVLGFNLLGDALRDILDPRMRGT